MFVKLWRRLENKTCALRSHANQQTGDIVETSNLIGEFRIELMSSVFLTGEIKSIHTCQLSNLNGEIIIALVSPVF